MQGGRAEEGGEDSRAVRAASALPLSLLPYFGLVDGPRLDDIVYSVIEL